MAMKIVWLKFPLCSLNAIWDGHFKGLTKKTLTVFFLTQVQVLSTDDNQFKVSWVVVYTEDGGRFHVEFQNKWYTSEAPGSNFVMTAHYEDPNIAKILTKIESVETKIDNAVIDLKSYIYQHS